jgi:long-subunit acyl-CoA synthetase (AMP-forming)
MKRSLKLTPRASLLEICRLARGCIFPGIALLDPDDHRSALDQLNEPVNARLGSVGKPLPSVATEVHDKDGGFPTPDASYLDDQGYLFLSGRADDMIVRGGENIAPGEIDMHHDPNGLFGS